MVYHHPSELDFAPDELPFQPLPHRVVLTDPAYYDVSYVINPHMADHVGGVDPGAARAQWTTLRDSYATLGFETLVAESYQGLPDLVFCANQTLPYRLANGQTGVVLSRMYAPQRKPEVAHFASFFRSLGYAVSALPGSLEGCFEGMGDALWHADSRMLWGGYGFRTSASVYPFISELLDVPVLSLRLEDPDFYHLDTCLSVLDRETALYFPGAFDAEGLALIRHVFPRLLEAPESEARRLLACNAHCPDGTHVLVQEGCMVTTDRLRDAGFHPISLPTDEFLKSGASVYCMKQMIW